MREAQDTFLRFLYDNLSVLTTPVTVHPIRKDPNKTSAGVMQSNALNVGFGKIEFGVLTTTMYVKLIIVADSELVAADMLQSVWTLLSTRFFTELYDYTTPTSPVATGTMLMWKRDRVKFNSVDVDKYCQYNCLLPVEFHPATT